MGSGERFEIKFRDPFGIGFYAYKFPFALTLYISFLWIHIKIGLGKAYDKRIRFGWDYDEQI